MAESQPVCGEYYNTDSMDGQFDNMFYWTRLRNIHFRKFRVYNHELSDNLPGIL